VAVLLSSAPAESRGARLSRAEQRFVDVLLALSAFHWGLRALVRPEGLTTVSLTLVGLDLTAGLLFLFRRPANQHASLRDTLLCLGSVVLGGWALALAPDYAAWPPAAAWLFAAAGGMAVLSLSWLGRSFAVLPSLREVVVRGPYRWVRHPAYAAESLMVVASVLAGPTLPAALIGSLAIALVVVRIFVEERFLGQTETYRQYQARVAHRLVPGVW